MSATLKIDKAFPELNKRNLKFNQYQTGSRKIDKTFKIIRKVNRKINKKIPLLTEWKPKKWRITNHTGFNMSQEKQGYRKEGILGSPLKFIINFINYL